MSGPTTGGPWGPRGPGGAVRAVCVRRALGGRTWAVVVAGLLAFVVLARPAPAQALGSTLSEAVTRLGDALDRSAPPGALGDARPVGYALSVRIERWPERGGHLVALLDGLLRERLERLVRGRGAVPGVVERLADPAPEVTHDQVRGLAAARGLPLALLVEVAVVGGHLELRATLVRGARGFWERALRSGEGVVATAFSRARLDVELRTLLDGPVQPAVLAPRLAPLRLPAGSLPAEIVALAVCDADEDGRDDVVALGRDELVVFGGGGSGGGAAVTRLSLDAMPPADAPCRVLYGAIVPVPSAHGGCRLVVGSSDHEGVALVEADDEGVLVLRPAAPPGALLAASPLEGEDALLVGVTVPGQAALAGPLSLWSPGEGPRTLGERAPVGGWVRRFVLRRPEPGALDVLEARVGRDGAAVVALTTRVTREAWPLGRRGGALVVADLDDDGAPECLVTSSALPPAEDRLELLRLPDGAPAARAWATASPPVRALAAGDLDDDGDLEVVVAVDVGPRDGRLLVLELRDASRPAEGGP